MNLTVGQAFEAMKILLEEYWISTGKPDELGSLLSSLDNSFSLDGLPHDQALWADWIKACEKVVSSGEDFKLR